MEGSRGFNSCFHQMEKIMLDFERKVQRKEGRDATPEERALFVAKLEAYFAAQQACVDSHACVYALHGI